MAQWLGRVSQGSVHDPEIKGPTRSAYGFSVKKKVRI